MFAPFERLTDTRDPTGLGLRLTLARGTLEPEMTPGGGLTMTISLPAVVTP
jgi:two-component system sensor histidine kinase KdpD